MITIARFDSPEEAYLFRSFLESRGVESAVLDEHIAQLFWHYRMATGGVRVVIHDEEDLETAVNTRHEYFNSITANPPLVTEVRAWPLVLLLSSFFGLPFLLFGRKKLTKDQSSNDDETETHE